MIQYVKRKEIDIVKYNACIETSINSRIYAYSWYLDIVATNWDVLVLNDYEAVMPLPWRQKYFIKYIYPPAWTQQLGVFSKSKISLDLIKQFVHAIPKKFKKITIQFNAENDLTQLKTESRVNYVLPLNKSYEEIYNGFRKDRKYRLKQVNSKNYVVIKTNVEDLIDVGKRDYSFLKISNEDYERLKELSALIENNIMGFIIGVYSENKQFLGGSIFLKDRLRITYLFSVSTEIGKKEQIITQVLNEVINQNSNTNILLDFEGSMVKGIANFYKSFGGVDEGYTIIRKILF